MSDSISRRDLFRRKPAATPDPTSEPARAMPTDPTAVGADDAKQPPLPELAESVLDDATIDALFRDIARCTTLLEVVPKYAARGHVGSATVSLDEARTMLRERTMRAVQLRYRHDDTEWWDTLIAQPEGVKIVRIRHDFDSPPSS